MGKKSLKSRFFIVFALSLVSILGIYILDRIERSPVARGQSWWAFPQTKEVRYYTPPEKVVFQPWRVQHNVYAVFMIPQEYRYDVLKAISRTKSWYLSLKKQGFGNFSKNLSKTNFFLLCKIYAIAYNNYSSNLHLTR